MPLQQAHFIGQLTHDSKGFSRISENLNYSVSGPTIFSTRMTQTQREQLGRKDNAPPLSSEQQRAIANIVYGGRLGNPASDDGWRYRGPGLLKITLRDSYLACGRRISLELVAEPDLQLREAVAARSAGWFWKNTGATPSLSPAM